MANRNFGLDFFLLNQVFKALAHPARRKIVAMLQNGLMTSGDIAEAFDMAWPSVTGHLTSLKDAGLVKAERAGTSVRYRLNMSAAEEAVGFLMSLMQQPLAESASSRSRPEQPSSRSNSEHIENLC